MAAFWKALPPCVVVQCVMLLLAFLQTCDSVPGLRRRRQSGMENLFYTSVCESKTMDLRCPVGFAIHIETANFGRTDNVTCTSGPVITSECFSDNAKEIVANSCDDKSSCSIQTTDAVFDNDCPPGTKKYLEVLFACLKVPTTIAPPTTPARETTTVTTKSPTTTPQPRERTKQPIIITQLPNDATTLSPDGTTTMLLPVTTKAATTATTRRPPTTTPTTPSTTVVQTTRKPEFCMPIIVRGVQWEHAPAGTIDVQACPPGHTGQAMWRCDGSPARWTPESGPDLSDCISLKLKNISDQLENGASVATISQDLVETIDEGEELYGGDIVAATAILTTSLENLDKELENATVAEKNEKTKEVTMNYLKVGSTILEDTNLDSWDDLSKEVQTETASSLITSLEESAFLLANTLEDDQPFIDEEENVVMEVVVRTEDDDDDLIFPDPNNLSDDWKGITDSITLPADAIKGRNKDGKSKIVLLAYNNIGQFLGTDDMEETSTVRTTIKPAKQVARRPCSSEPEEMWEDLGQTVNSRVLSVSINDPWETTPLVKPVNLTFQHAVTGENVSDPVCSFWKFDNKSGEFRTGEWSDKGCVMVHNNDTHTVCSCDHLTNFAVIMNVKRGVPLQRGHAFALSFITYFGFIISIPCLILALITFSIFKNLQSDRTTIHKNLCLTLIMAEVIFVAGISQTANQTVCAVIAILLHYFFLSAFAWMCLEGIQLYIMLVEVFEAESSRRKYYYPFGYIVPLVIVGISAAVDFESYGTPDYCWMCAESNLQYAFIAPVCLIIFGNVLFLSMALFIMCQHSTLQTNPKEKTPKEKATRKYRRLSASIAHLRRTSSIFSKHGRKRSKSLVRGALVLLCLLGVTWAFGLLYVTDDLIVFAYLFTITNAFQGLFIFLFHCCMNDKVRKEYRRYVRNSTWIPTCIREQYGGTFLTNSNQQNSYRSSSAQKRPDSKRFSNTTGSYSMDNQKISNSSVYRNSGQYEQVKFNSEMSVPEEEEQVDFGAAKVIADEGISMDFEEHPVHESTRVDAADTTEPQDNKSVITLEFQPLILDLDVDDEKHAKLINVGQAAEREPSPIEMHPLIRESGIGGSRSGSSCSEDFSPASPLAQDKPNKAHVFSNCGPCGMTGSMPDLINPLTAHARKARMDLVPVAYNNTDNVADVAASDNVHKGYHTLPQTAPTTKAQNSPTYKYPTDSVTSPWYKRASRMDDIDSDDHSAKEAESLGSPTSLQSPRSTRSALETVI
ncbi:adhesion G protein-coupled receptor L2-like isoform X5 [Lytechinus variegatus]|uniref:adhesion G protein-coupled receptor L2-like isoform X5 n=1 Tax=Lytechinus variegatus TaxID=7654 RepID=UPI001BB1E3D9|nr:adhesion G protein-coupled receptor L2-like isoform X5 [Lytechinus variegatus]